jgi:uncharacterized protein (TIGR03437 family)
LRTYSALFVFFLSAFTVQAQFVDGQAARAVFGQTNFTEGNPSPSQTILGGVSGLAYYSGILYVADSNRVASTPNNSRIMAFPTAQVPTSHADVALAGLTNADCYLCGFPASFSLGQSTWTPADASTGFTPGRTQNTMANATGVATDGHYFAVADTDNNRVLLWKEVPTMMDQNADLVLGQPDFTTLQTPTSTFASSSSLRGPQGVWIQNGKLFVADTQNNRVLIWNSMPTTNNQPADLVLGQATFNTNTAPSPSSTPPTVTAAQLENPTSVTSDGTHLFVSDLGFNRVLIWNSIPTTMDQSADVAVGQPDLVSSVPNNPVVCTNLPVGSPQDMCQTSLNFPRFALSDGTRLFIADGGNDRVVIFNHIPTTNGAAFDAVIGSQNFTDDVNSSASISIASTAIDNTGGVDLTPAPQALAYDGTNLYVSDPYNRRVLIFTPGDTILPPNSIVNWASEIVRQEGVVTIGLATSTATITTGDTVTVTIAGTAYMYTIVKNDTLDTIAQGLVAQINANSGDPNVIAIFAGTGTGTLYLSSKATNLGYDTISLAATTSNPNNEAAYASGGYLSAGTGAVGAIGMLVEVDGTNLSDNTATASTTGGAALPNTLGGVQVYMDGYATPLLKVSPTQIVTQIPYQYGDRNSTSIYVRTVHNDGSVTVTNAEPVYIAPANPGLFNAPAYAGQPRPWPITQAYHQPGNATAVVSIDGSVTAGNMATVTIQGVSYSYTVVAADTLTTITQNLINLINASDQNVIASFGGAFTRIVLTAKQAGSAGYGITVAGSASTNATVTVTAYNTITCCVVTPGSLISTVNPAGPGELITVTGVGLGYVTDPTNTAENDLGTGVPYNGPVPNTAENFVSATMEGTTAQVIFAELPTGSYGTYNVQLVVPTTAATSNTTTLNIAQNAFISNTVTIPTGPTVLYVAPTPTPTAPATNFHEVIDAPAAGATVSGTILASGWALSTASALNGLSVYIDGQFYGAATRGTLRPDVCAAFTSPNCPDTGWYLNVNTTQLADGQHTMSITATSIDGGSYSVAQSFNTANGSTAQGKTQHANIDAPGSNVIYRGVNRFSGWAVDDSTQVTGVNIYIDGALKGSAIYGGVRPDVCAVYPGRPGCPDVGWSFQFDTNQIADGNHTLVAEQTGANGQTYALSKTFQVQNWSGVGSTNANIDSPSAGAGTFSSAMVVSGWAVDSNSVIGSVGISVDGVSYGSATYGVSRPDVCTAYPNSQGCPNVGFAATVDTRSLADGQHTLIVTVNPAAGESSTYTRTFIVANLGTAANPILAIIDAPVGGSTVSGTVSPSGWALSTASGDSVTSVALLVDGQAIGNASYGTPRTDVCGLYPTSSGCPGVGWSSSINSTELFNGSHVLEATVSTAKGHRASISRTFNVSNAASGPGHISFDTPGAHSNPFLGTALFSGWALNTNTSVSSLSVTIDGVPYGQATYGLSRPDVCTLYPSSPNCPGVGWSIGVNTTQLTDGTHVVGITEINADGSFASSSNSFTVANYSTADPMTIHLDSPPNSIEVPLFGVISFAGWAIDNDSALSAVKIAVDGVPVGNATYGLSRPDVCSVFTGRAGCPNVGFGFYYDTTLIPNGIHTLDVTGVTTSGQSSTITQQMSIAN